MFSRIIQGFAVVVWKQSKDKKRLLNFLFQYIIDPVTKKVRSFYNLFKYWFGYLKVEVAREIKKTR